MDSKGKNGTGLGKLYKKVFVAYFALLFIFVNTATLYLPDDLSSASIIIFFEKLFPVVSSIIDYSPNSAVFSVGYILGFFICFVVVPFLPKIISIEMEINKSINDANISNFKLVWYFPMVIIFFHFVFNSLFLFGYDPATSPISSSKSAIIETRFYNSELFFSFITASVFMTSTCLAHISLRCISLVIAQKNTKLFEGE